MSPAAATRNVDGETVEVVATIDVGATEVVVAVGAALVDVVVAIGALGEDVAPTEVPLAQPARATKTIDRVARRTGP